MDAKDLIAQGITLARRGQNDKAREMFNLALVTDPRNENAWLWLSTVAVDDAEKEDCLRQVLALNPQNVNAANELQKISEKRRSELSAKVAALSAARSAIETPKVEAAAVPVAVAATGAAAPTVVRKVAPRRRGGRAQTPTWLKLAIIGGFGGLILLIALGSFNLIGRVLNPMTPTAHADAVADGNGSGHVDLYTHMDAHRLSAARVHGHAHSHADDHADAQRNTDGYADIDPDADQDAHTNPDLHAHTHADGNLYADFNAHTDVDTHFHSHTDAVAD